MAVMWRNNKKGNKQLGSNFTTGKKKKRKKKGKQSNNKVVSVSRPEHKHRVKSDSWGWSDRTCSAFPSYMSSVQTDFYFIRYLSVPVGRWFPFFFSANPTFAYFQILKFLQHWKNCNLTNIWSYMMEFCHCLASHHTLRTSRYSPPFS